MNKDIPESFESHFSKLKDPRVNRHKLYPLSEILFVVLCGSICGAESWRDYVIFGKEKLDFFRQYFPFKEGIASKNTYARVFAALDNDDVRLYLETEFKKSSLNATTDRYEDVDKGHGRIETRTCFVSSNLDWLEQKEQWEGLKTVAMIEETRELGDKTTIERRFFISSLPLNAKKIAETVRAHWLVENALHWSLNVIFNEDDSRVRKDNAGENMAIVRHITLNMLNNTKKSLKDIGVKALRKKAGWGRVPLINI